ncbi:MAG: AhpC/TSA family protein [Tannerellaceae bacterium]|jgi:thiol-disulfide isomerase/thioredoxin|nr:AhpC/TSA family protein [Tannerellaceae bacterium]
MKKTVYAAVICLSLWMPGCRTEVREFCLRAEGLSVQGEIWAYDMAGDEAPDTIRVHEGGFVYRREVGQEPQLWMLTDGATMMCYVIAERGSLHLAGDTGLVTGTALNDRLARLLRLYREVGADLEEEKSALLELVDAHDQELTPEQAQALEDLSREQAQREEHLLRSFYAEDKTTILGALELILLQGLVSDEEFASLYAEGSETVRRFPPILRFWERSAAREQATVGSDYVDIRGVHPSDTTQSLCLSDFVGKGTYVLLDFWASWCAPCRGAMPDLKRLDATYRDRGLKVIGIVVSDTREDHLLAANALGVTWTQIFDSSNVSVAQYAIEAIPLLLLLDPNGRILMRTHDKEEVIEKIRQLLGD